MVTNSEKGNQDEDHSLDKHEAVSDATKDPNEPGKAVSLVGYIGPSKEPNSIRLYLSVDFDTYIDMPKDKILCSQNVSKKNINERGRIRIWVPRDLEVKTSKTDARSIQAEFLKGEIFGGSFVEESIVGLPDILDPGPPRSEYPWCSSEGGPCRTFPAVC